MSNPLYRELIQDIRALMEAEAHPRRRTIRLSPEVAAKLEALPGARASSEAAASSSGRAEPQPQPKAPAFPAAGRDETPGPDPETRRAALDALEKTVSMCTKCELHETRIQTVFADGDPMARLVFVGEAPGGEEDRQGVPFVGRAGQLLTDIITKGMGLRREEVYICNVIKCRPPNNRDPKPAEIEQCEPYLVEQLRLVQPEVICALGAHAARTLLRTNVAVGKLRGEWHEYCGIPLRVTYHPSYLLRNPADKRKTWEDIQVIMEYLGLPASRGKGS
ncbi:MAG: uracil-DNA glycosylase family protein [Candidatus Hydrogenedentota bacterium]